MRDPNSNFTEVYDSQALPFDIGSASLASGIVLAVLSPITVIANGLLLLAISRDPFRTFRSPLTCFLIGLALTDLITGLVPEPMVAVCYFLTYLEHPTSAHCPKVFPIAGITVSITTNSSFLLVLAFTVAQYVAVSCPINYKRFINTKHTVICVLLIWAYTAIFELLGKIGVSQETVEKVDLHLHSTLTIILSVLMYALLHRTFSRQMRHHSFSAVTTRTSPTPTGAAAAALATGAAAAAIGDQANAARRKRQNTVERKFVKINLLLISIFVFCSLPSAVTWYIYFYWPEMRNSRSFFIARVIVDNTLYLKFVLDPFVYAWRLPRYRQALMEVIICE